MYIKNLHNGLPEPVDVGDILYSYYQQGGRLDRENQKTWSFRCQGLLSTRDADYILGPGNAMYLLGINCFTTDGEAREIGYEVSGGLIGKKDIRRQYRLIEMSDEERVKI